jgi:hypothetical protein
LFHHFQRDWGDPHAQTLDTVEKLHRPVAVSNIPTREGFRANLRCVLEQRRESFCRENARSGVFQQYP